MAVDVTCLGRMLKEEQKTNGIRQEGGLSSSLITRDLLGSSSYSRLGSKELDLDLQVPLGWEKRLDLESGKVYLKRCTSSDEDEKQEQKNPRVQDLNYPPAEDSLELKLFPTNNSNYQIQSVCTLDKVKSALERANNNNNNNNKNNKALDDGSGSGSSSNDRMSLELEQDSSSSTMLFAGGCPSCLLYVLISKADPKCPRCHATVPSPLFKKPRIDLNCTSSLN